MDVWLMLQGGGGEPVEADGLAWGGTEPVRFRGMVEGRGGLVGLDGSSYLFRPVCYDSNRDCFGPRRLAHDWSTRPGRWAWEVVDFPDSDPVEVSRVGQDFLGDGEDFLRLLLQMAAQLNGEMLFLSGIERIAPGAGAEGAVSGEAVPDAARKAAELAGSIRYAVRYKNGETLFLSGIERIAPGAGAEGAGIQNLVARLEAMQPQAIVEKREHRPATKKQIEAARKRRKMPPALEKRAVKKMRELVEKERKPLEEAACCVIRLMGRAEANGGWDIESGKIPSTTKTLKRAYERSYQKPKT